MIETVIITESWGRQKGYSPRTAMEVAKKHGNATIFFRNKDMKIEYRIIFVDGRIADLRVKCNHKECLSEDIYDDIPNWDAFINSLGL